MEDGVKFIFKTLIKVPVIIFFSFFVFNILAFFFMYFKMLGASYVVMQTAVENNYLPAQEAQTLYEFVNTFNDIEMVEDASVVIAADLGTDGSYYNIRTMSDVTDTSALYGDADARKRRQYGSTVTVGVTCNYTLIWPLDYRATTAGNTGVAGMSSNTTSFKSDAQLASDRESAKSKVPITIIYTVPGLKYYPDMLR